MLLDCGLMFPDLDMLGIDLVLPDFTWLRGERRPHRRLHRHPRPRGPRRRPVVPAARAVVPGLRLGAHVRPGPEPHRGGRRAPTNTELIPVADGERRSIGAVRRGVHPGHPLGPARASPPRSTRPRARSCTPATGSSTSRRSTGASPTSPGSAPSPARPPTTTAGIRLLLGDSTNADERRPLRGRSVRSAGRAVRPVPSPTEGRRIVIACFASHIHRVQQICRRRHRRSARTVATLGHVDEEERAARPRDGPPAHPRRAARRHRGHRRPSTRPSVCVISTGIAGRAAVGPGARWPPARTGGSSIGREDTVILSSHPIPGNESNVRRR